jgi:ATP-binding cassette subfamily B protein
MSDSENFWSSWQERLSALRNVPPILRIVWRSGPGVVSFGIGARIVAALLPVAIGYIPKLIIDILDHALKTHEPVPTRLWWLVGVEFGLAVLNGSFCG